MERQTAIELFRENMSDMGRVGPVSLFLDNAASLTDPAVDGHNPAAVDDYSRVQDAQAKAKALDAHQGVISGNKDGIRGGIAERVADAQDTKEAKATRDAKRADDTAFYLGWSHDYSLGVQIAQNMFADMSDQDVFDFSDRMETETGKSIHVWAEEILSDEQRERQANETDAEYERRIQQETIAAMQGPDGEFLPEYSDHPLARWVQQQEEYQSVKQEMEKFLTSRPSGQTVEADKANLAARNITDGGLRVEFAAAATNGDNKLDNVVRKDRDSGADVDLDTSSDVAANAATLNKFF